MSATDRRELLLETALMVFAEHGFDRASLDDVAEAAGVSKALIYEHFGSKRELHDAALRAAHDELVRRVLEAIAGSNAPGDRLRLGIEAFLGFVEEHRDAWRMVHRNINDPDLAPTLRRVQDETRDIVAALIAAEAPPLSPIEGVDTDVAAEMLAQQLVGAGQSLANWWDEHHEVTREQMLQAHMDFAWLGLERLVAGERWSVS